MAKTVRQMLANQTEVLAIGPTVTVLDALKLMAEHNVGAVLVVEDGKLVGILTERDYARKVALQGKRSVDTLVRDVMSTSVITINPDWRAEQCMVLMDEKHIRHLPVLDGDRLVGVVSIRDAVRAIIDEQQFTIEALERYITS